MIAHLLAAELDDVAGERENRALERLRAALNLRLARNLVDVAAAISALWHRLRLDASGKRFSKQADLPALVVDVVLTLHREARRFHHPCDDIAHDRAAPVTEQHWPGRVRAHELHLYTDASADLAPPPLFAGAGDGIQLRLKPGRLQGDIDEPRRGHHRPP